MSDSTLPGPLSNHPAFRQGLLLRGMFGSAGPGLTGVFEVGVRPSGDSTELWHWDDDSDSAYLIEVIGQPFHWTVAAGALASSTLGGETGIGPITVTGAEGDVADVLRLAWGDDEQKCLARQLATCSEAQLAAIRSEVGPLCGSGARRRLLRLASDLNADGTATFGSLFSDDVPTGTVVASLRGRAKKHLTSVARDARADERARVAALRPFAPTISALVDAWVGPWPSHGNIAVRMATGGRRKSLSDFLERYALDHAQLPRGRHNVPDHRGLNHGSWDVDFDLLHQSLTDTSAD